MPHDLSKDVESLLRRRPVEAAPGGRDRRRGGKLWFLGLRDARIVDEVPPPMSASTATLQSPDPPARPVQTYLQFDHEDFRSDPRDWWPAKNLVAELEEELSAARQHLLLRVTAWVLATKVFRKIERRKMYEPENGPTARDMEFHRAILTSLLGNGEMLLLDLKSHQEIDPNNIGLSMDAIASTVSQMRFDLSHWHGDMKPEMAEEILSQVFGVEG